MSLARPAAVDLAVRLFGGSPERTLALLRAAWPLAVGPELARRTEVVAIEGTTLRVKVADATWRKALLKIRGPLHGRLRRVAGDLAPARLAFCEGPVSCPPQTRPPTLVDRPAALPSAALAAAAERIEDPVVRARFLDSATRYLTRSRS
jgi:Dna[CI] antecedent, DciA